MIADFVINNDTTHFIEAIGVFVFDIGNFISQLFLINILWHLGNKHQIKNIEKQLFPPVIEADFDEEAELQADMWNQFVRVCRESEPYIYRPSVRSVAAINHADN
jgi:hypothetical protein